MFDRVLGLAAGYAIVVGNLNVSFRNLLPLRQLVQVDSEIVSVEGRQILMRGKILDGRESFFLSRVPLY